MRVTDTMSVNPYRPCMRCADPSRLSLSSRWSWVLCTALLTGCATAPVPTPDALVPERLAVASDWRAPLPQGVVRGTDFQVPWWQMFNDDALTSLIDRALKTHTSLQSAQAALAQARAQRDVAMAATLPGLRASASAQRSDTGQTPAGNAFRAGLDASWEIDVFGGRRSALNASDADVVASAAQLGQARVSLAAEVALVYLEWRAQQQRLQVAQANLQLQEASLQLTRWRAQAGLASQLDLDQALAAVAQTRAAIPPLVAGVAQNRNALAVLSGLTPQEDMDAPSGADVPVPSDTIALAIPADTLKQRPDVRAAEARLDGALARLAQANAARYPTFSLGGTLDWRAPRITDLFDAGALTRALVASVGASLWDGGAARAQVRVQEAALEQARVSLEVAVVTALQDVETALLDVQASRDRLGHLSDAARAAINAETLARHRYAGGLIDNRALIDAQRTRLNAESDLATARATWGADHVRLVKALGGGWSPATLTQDLDHHARH